MPRSTLFRIHIIILGKVLCRFNCFIVLLLLTLSFWPTIYAVEQPLLLQEKGKPRMTSITGEFEVKLLPAETGDPTMGMMLLDKKYHGELSGTGKGRMLTGMTDIKGSAAYVAIERVEGVLQGKKGSFLIQHSGIMDKGKQSLTILIVPDSGTDELVGISGTMGIRIVDRKHFYDINYQL